MAVTRDSPNFSLVLPLNLHKTYSSIPIAVRPWIVNTVRWLGTTLLGQQLIRTKGFWKLMDNRKKSLPLGATSFWNPHHLHNIYFLWTFRNLLCDQGACHNLDAKVTKLSSVAPWTPSVVGTATENRNRKYCKTAQPLSLWKMLWRGIFSYKTATCKSNQCWKTPDGWRKQEGQIQ